MRRAFLERAPAIAPGSNRRTSRTLAAALVCLGVTAAPAASDSASWVFEQLQRARRSADAEALDRRVELDAAARKRARAIAALPHERRLASRRPVAQLLQEQGLGPFRRVEQHLDLLRGYRSPSAAYLQRWRKASAAWTRALSADWDAAGVALQRAADGWWVVLTVLVEDLDVENLRALELRTVDAVNEVRRRHGLAELLEREEWTLLARAHSADMADRGYFDHRSPEGRGPAERARLRAAAFRALAENIQRSRGLKDPVATAVREWMASAGHRAPILSSEFEVTGVGVAAAADGTLYFTQLFLRPVSDSDGGAR